MAMIERYETVTGIYNHFAPDSDQLALVTMFPSEDYTGLSRYYDLIKEFGLLDFGRLWNISLKDYLELPSWQIDMMREISAEIRAVKKTTIDDVLGDINGK